VYDVISALVNLGYQRPEILRALASIPRDSIIELDNTAKQGDLAEQSNSSESFNLLLKKVLSKLSSGMSHDR
jgi:Holliday junction resolvasome RuvABC DNA-binding subunit